jgi:hypothetical protein
MTPRDSVGFETLWHASEGMPHLPPGSKGLKGRHRDHLICSVRLRTAISEEVSRLDLVLDAIELILALPTQI